MASGPPPLSTFTQPTPASPSHSSTSASAFTRKRSAPVLATQPASKKHSLPKLPSSAFYQLSAASDTSVKRRKRGRERQKKNSGGTTERRMTKHQSPCISRQPESQAQRSTPL
ncbi:hypothetical protein CgunFtcFv8_011103 [Champsocephalus gunnari]|uniref:Uncharacterized protein n=1 Tax=Champsocephalus gunnari TaxID=52237 RepID=A0AAN8DWC0_CHAGU|nr:hypothetical protein CgunFtcFv8_011103 [Champsocephalus gunnari]